MTTVGVDDGARPTVPGTSAGSFFLRFILCWTAFAFLSRYPGYLHFDTAEIFSWSTLGFEPGFTKHPPLLPWIVTAVDYVFPASWVTLVMLGVVNVAAGAFFVWLIADMTVGRLRAPLVMALFMLSAYTVWHGLKLNHNSVLISLWPATVYVFLCCLRQPTWWRGVLLGVVAAASVYAKYNSVLLIAALFFASVVSKRSREFYSSSAPYIGGLVFVALLAPHVWWEHQHNFQTFGNADNKLAERGMPPWRLLGENLQRFIPVALAFFTFRRWIGREDGDETPFYRELLIIALVPLVLTIGLTMALGLRGSQSWTTPVYCFVPLVLAALIRRPDAEQLRVLNRIFSGAFIVLPFIGMLVTLNGFRSGEEKATNPIPEISEAAASIWRSTVGTPVGIVAGVHRYAVGASVALDEHPMAWPYFSGVWWVPENVFDDRGALVFCAAEWPDCSASVEAKAAGRLSWHCDLTMHRTLAGLEGKAYAVRVYIIPPRAFSKSIAEDQRCPTSPSQAH